MASKDKKSEEIRNKLQALRQQFYSSDEAKGRSKIQRSMTERVGYARKPNFLNSSNDSGLSSPGSIVSQSDYDTCDLYSKPIRGMTRHLSMDNTYYTHRPNVTDLEMEAQDNHKIVDELSSTRTMRRRRLEASNLSITDRKRLGTQAIGSYAPIAPAKSQWGLMFDEMMLKLKGQSLASEETDGKTCHNNKASAENDTGSYEYITSVLENIENIDSSLQDEADKRWQSEKDENDKEKQEILKARRPSRLMRSVTENYGNRCKPTVNLDMKSLMRSISFQRPDLATYNQPISRLRRTDSNNEVWIERKNMQNKYQQEPASDVSKKPEQKANSSSNLKRSATWKRITRMFSYSKSKS